MHILLSPRTLKDIHYEGSPTTMLASPRVTSMLRAEEVLATFTFAQPNIGTLGQCNTLNTKTNMKKNYSTYLACHSPTTIHTSHLNQMLATKFQLIFIKFKYINKRNHDITIQ